MPRQGLMPFVPEGDDPDCESDSACRRLQYQAHHLGEVSNGRCLNARTSFVHLRQVRASKVLPIGIVEEARLRQVQPIVDLDGGRHHHL